MIVAADCEFISSSILSKFPSLRALKIVPKSLLILGITTSVSGSPILTLYSITFGSSPTLISPIKINPLYGILSNLIPSIVGLIILSNILFSNLESTKGTGETAPIPPVFKPVSPSPILL